MVVMMNELPGRRGVGTKGGGGSNKGPTTPSVTHGKNYITATQHDILDNNIITRYKNIETT